MKTYKGKGEMSDIEKKVCLESWQDETTIM